MAGRGAGTGLPGRKMGAVIIELAPFAPLTAAEDTAVGAAQRYGDFVGMPVHVAHTV